MDTVFLGTMGWSYNFWRLYDGLEPSSYLNRYAEHFNSVEVNSSFYRIPSKSSVQNWEKQVPEGFVFSLKIPQSISHSHALDYDSEKLDAFLDHIKPLKEKLGPLLLQLPPNLPSEYSGQLSIILDQLNEYNVAVEFRHKDWFKEETYTLLRDHNTALVYVEHPWQPTAMVETGKFTYLRLEGDRKKVNGEKGETEQDRHAVNLHWADWISSEQSKGRSTYLYVSKYYSGYPPTDIEQIRARLEAIKEA
ncbi:DUF72 domain-containing protein [Candidatus Bathyarchaeota archaeon]|nr:DUF72 domain-containing protein [Candidatus Bathyarchaeota archaeon]